MRDANVETFGKVKMAIKIHLPRRLKAKKYKYSYLAKFDAENKATFKKFVQ